MKPRHGTNSSYVTGCRCDDCRIAANAVGRSARLIKRSQRVMIDGKMTHPLAVHGTETGYAYYHCRCIPCTEIKSSENRRRRRKRKEQ